MHILFILIAVAPFGVLSRGSIHLGQQLFFMLTALICLSVQINNRFIRYFLYYSELMIGLTLLFGVLGMVGEESAGRAAQTLIFFLSGTVILFMAQSSTIKLETAYDLICVAALCQVFVCIGQFFGFDIIDLVKIDNLSIIKVNKGQFLSGTLGNTNFLAAFIAISFPFFLRPKWCYFLPLHIFVLYFANTSGAVIAIALGLIYLFRNFYISIAFITASLSYFCFIDMPHFQDRIDIWIPAVSQIFSSIPVFLFGNGPGADWGNGFAMHNDWLQMFHWFGLIGFVFLILATITINKSDIILTTCFIIACVNALVNNPMFLAPSAFLILAIIGLMERDYDISRNIQICRTSD